MLRDFRPGSLFACLNSETFEEYANQAGTAGAALGAMDFQEFCMKQNANVQVYNSAVNVLPLQRTLLQETAKIIVHGKLMEDETVQLDLGWAPGGPARETLYFGLLSDLKTQWPDTAESRRVRAIIRKRQRAAGAEARDLRVLCLN